MRFLKSIDVTEMGWMQLAVLFVPCAFSRTQGLLCKAQKELSPFLNAHCFPPAAAAAETGAQGALYADNQLSPALNEKAQARGSHQVCNSHFSMMGFSGLTQDMETQP